MAKRLEVTPHKLTLEHLFSFTALQMPLFQRPYSWGKRKSSIKGKALEYVIKFLLDKDAVEFSGTIAVYSTHRYNFTYDKNIILFMADGQHRICTITLLAFALANVLSLRLARLDEEQQEAANEFLESPALTLPLKAGINCIVNDPSTASKQELVLDFVRSRLKDIAAIEARLAAIEATYKAACLKLSDTKSLTKQDRRVRKAEMTVSKNDDINRAEKEIADIKAHPVMQSYFQIYEHLENKNDAGLMRTAERFVDRFQRLTITLQVLEPLSGHPADLADVEACAFELFTNQNGDAVPLGSGELLKAFVENNAPADHVIRDIFREGASNTALDLFQLTDPSELAVFLARVSHPDYKDCETFSWVRQHLYGAPEPVKSLNELAAVTSSLLRATSTLQSLKNAIGPVFMYYLKTLQTNGARVFATRFFMRQPEVVPEATLVALFKLMVLMELVAHYIPPSGRRMRLSKELPALQGTFEAGFQFVLRGFEASNVQTLRERLLSTLIKTPWGSQQLRGFAKLLLLLADTAEHGTTVMTPAWAQYDYEHVLPSVLTAKSLNELADPDYRDALVSILEKPAENQRLANALGNGALLEGKANSSFKNALPSQKLVLTATECKHNSWWPSHLKALQDSAGQWDDAVITARTEAQAQLITQWLLELEPHVSTTLDAR